jgi:hypothetical protein
MSGKKKEEVNLKKCVLKFAAGKKLNLTQEERAAFVRATAAERACKLSGFRLP